MSEPHDPLSDGHQLAHIYGHRFDELELGEKRLVWQTLCESYFQALVSPSSTVLDLGAGACEFINSIRAKRKYAVDLNPDTARSADGDVTVLSTSSEHLVGVADQEVDVVFSSNFFEHLPTKRSLIMT